MPYLGEKYLFLILFLSVQFFTVNNDYYSLNTAYASQIKIFPQKRPSVLLDYEESLKSIHDVIEKEGGKKVGLIKINKIKYGENLNKFLLRVGFKKVETQKIIKSIKLLPKSYEVFHKIPINHKLKYSLPSNLIGGCLEFKIEKNKDIYVWQDLNKLMANYKRFLTIDVERYRIQLLKLIEESHYEH